MSRASSGVFKESVAAGPMGHATRRTTACRCRLVCHQSIGIPITLKFSSATAIQRADVDGIAKHLQEIGIRSYRRTIERLVAWSGTAADPSELAAMHTQQWQQLNEVRQLFSRQILAAEQEMAGFLVKTPYILLLSVTGINVISAARLAGEAGPIEHYASASAINGRAGLYPTRYQSDAVDYDGPLARRGNRKLRGAATQMADNLIKCHPHYRGLAALRKQKKVHLRDRRCRIANRAMRMVFQLVSGRQMWRGQGVDREYVLSKLQEFHRVHETPMEQVVRDMHEVFAWLPKSAYATEAKPLVELVRKKRRGVKRIGELLLPVLIRLGVATEEELQAVESNTSEAQSFS